MDVERNYNASSNIGDGRSLQAGAPIEDRGIRGMTREKQEVRGGPGACQPVSEPKAFTGRGRAGDAMEREAQRLRAALDRVHQELAGLSVKTRKVRGRRFYLMLQKRKVTGARFLRWRDTGAGGGHVPWHAVPEFIDREPASLHAWYERINRIAMELNDEEQLCRLALALCLRRHSRLYGDGSRDACVAGGARREPLAEK